MVDGVDGGRGVGEVHVDFEQEAGPELQGFGGDVGVGADEGYAVGVEGEVH